MPVGTYTPGSQAGNFNNYIQALNAQTGFAPSGAGTPTEPIPQTAPSVGSGRGGIGMFGPLPASATPVPAPSPGLTSVVGGPQTASAGMPGNLAQQTMTPADPNIVTPYGAMTDPAGNPIGTLGAPDPAALDAIAPPPTPEPTGLGSFGQIGTESMGPVSVPGVIAGGIVGGQQLQGVGNFAQGKPMSFGQQAALALPTAGFSFLANPISSAFGGGKGKDQQARDAVRDNLVKQGWAGEGAKIDAPWGTVDLYNDGGYRYKNQDGTERPVYNTDPSDPNAAQAIGWLNPLTHIMGDGDAKLASDFANQIYSEITKDGTKDINVIKSRVIDLYNKFQLKPSLVRDAVNSMKLDQGTKDAFFAAIDNLKKKQGGQDLTQPRGTETKPTSTAPANKPPVNRPNPESNINLKGIGVGGLKH